MKFLISFSLVLILAATSAAQIGGSMGSFDARSAALGNTYTAASRGVFAIGKNPANLALDEKGRLEIQTNIIPLPFPSVSMGFGTDFFSIADFNYFFGGVPDPKNPGKNIGRTLTQADKDRFISLFDNGGIVFTSASIPWLSFTYNAGESVGTFGFSMNDNIAMNFTFPKGLAPLAMNGNADNSTNTISDASMKAWYLRDYTVSYSRDINNMLVNLFNMNESLFKKFTVGVSLKYVQGFAYVSSESFKADLITSADKISIKTNATGYSAFSSDLGVKYEFDKSTYGKEISGTPFPSSAGSGFGIDLGFTAQMGEALTVAMALTDLGSVSWSTNAAKFTYNNTIDFTSFTEQSEQDTAEARAKRYKGEYVSDLSTSLPTAFRVGAAYQLDKAPFISSFPGTMLLVMDLNLGFNDLPGNSTKPRLSLGTEWKPMDWIPFIRTGISLGGLEKFNWSVGLGFNCGVFDLALGTKDFNSLLSNDAKHLSVAMDTRWKF